jgi:hypothetical protein
LKDQRTDLFQLERALGIKMERLRADATHSQPQSTEQTRPNADRPFHARPAHDRPSNHPSRDHRPSHAPKPSLICLPGEVLQAQVEG